MMDEMPTLLVNQLGHGRCAECDHGFIVMNRPWGVVQMVRSAHWREKIPEEYVMLIETDHMLMVPPPNRATAEMPVGFGFYYMIGTDPKLKPVVEKFLAPGISSAEIDNVGPSPIIITKAMLERVATPWWDMSVKMKGDSDANRVFGWVNPRDVVGVVVTWMRVSPRLLRAQPHQSAVRCDLRCSRCGATTSRRATWASGTLS